MRDELAGFINNSLNVMITQHLVCWPINIKL